MDPIPAIAAEPVVLAGQPYEVEIAIEDPGSDDAHEVRVAWGDGTTEEVGLDAGSMHRTVTLRHEYAAPGTYVIDVEVTDDEGGSGTATQRVEVGTGPG